MSTTGQQIHLAQTDESLHEDTEKTDRLDEALAKLALNRVHDVKDVADNSKAGPSSLLEPPPTETNTGSGKRPRSRPQRSKADKNSKLSSLMNGDWRERSQVQVNEPQGQRAGQPSRTTTQDELTDRFDRLSTKPAASGRNHVDARRRVDASLTTTNAYPPKQNQKARMAHEGQVKDVSFVSTPQTSRTWRKYDGSQTDAKQYHTGTSQPHNQKDLRRKNFADGKTTQRNEKLHVLDGTATDEPDKDPFGSSSDLLFLLPRPVPKPEYLDQASQPPRQISSPRPLLVVLDLNGTLVFRKVGRKNFIPRPHLQSFLHYLFANHIVMIWATATPRNVTAVSEAILGDDINRVVGIWNRQDCRLGKVNYRQRVQAYKQLSWVWTNKKMQSTAENTEIWSQANTVLVDDSTEKAAAEPYNHVKVEEFIAAPEQMSTDVLGQVVRYLEKARLQADVSAFIRAEPFVYDSSSPAFDWSSVQAGDAVHIASR